MRPPDFLFVMADVSGFFHKFAFWQNLIEKLIIGIMKLMKWITAALFAVAAVTLAFSCDEPAPDPVKKDPQMKVTPAEPDAIPAAGGEITLSLMSNVDWTVSGMPDWLAVAPASGAASNYKQEVKVTAQKNNGGAREAVLTFIADGLTQDVKIRQSHAFDSSAPSNALFYETLEKSAGSFTIQDVKVPEQLGFVWEHSSDYKCMKATAYENSTTKNYESESWLVSPDIDLTSVADAYLTFEHAGGYFGTASEEATVWISKAGGEWEPLVIEKGNYPTSWTFIEAGNWDLKSYVGNIVKLGFKYSSTAKKAGTWEIKNVAVLSGKHEDMVIPEIDPTKTQWMELPATDNDAYGYYSHSFSMKDKIYRNYSFAWSQKDLVSVWVAYPLSDIYTNGDVGRNEAWAYDPILGKDKSSNPGSGYAGDYDKGHQLPSEDRQSSVEANKQTFYGSNIAPQLRDHNGQIWLNLENKVRSVAKDSDTTYVVTGCTVADATEFSTDSDGKKITIPTAFFKAVLVYKKGADQEWTSAGFFTEHKKYSSNGLKAVSMTIDELEEMTGLDFFVNLAGKIGADEAAAVEKQNPAESSVWGL